MFVDERTSTAMNPQQIIRRQRSLSPEHLAWIGERIYGNDWRSKLARDLVVSRATVDRWVTGNLTIRPTNALAIRYLEEIYTNP